jgi:hypothetical protein
MQVSQHVAQPLGAHFAVAAEPGISWSSAGLVFAAECITLLLCLPFLRAQLEEAALNLGMGCLAAVEKVAERAAASPRCDTTLLLCSDASAWCACTNRHPVYCSRAVLVVEGAHKQGAASACHMLPLPGAVSACHMLPLPGCSKRLSNVTSCCRCPAAIRCCRFRHASCSI